MFTKELGWFESNLRVADLIGTSVRPLDTRVYVVPQVVEVKRAGGRYV